MSGSFIPEDCTGIDTSSLTTAQVARDLELIKKMLNSVHDPRILGNMFGYHPRTNPEMDLYAHPFPGVLHTIASFEVPGVRGSPEREKIVSEIERLGKNGPVAKERHEALVRALHVHDKGLLLKVEGCTDTVDTVLGVFALALEEASPVLRGAVGDAAVPCGAVLEKWRAELRGRWLQADGPVAC